MAGQEARQKAAELGYTTAIAVSDGRAIGWKTTPRIGKKTIRAIGVVIIAVIAGTTQGLTAYLLGSSYAVALGLIAGFLDMIPNIGATIGGFVLSLTLLAEEGLTAALIMLAVVLLTAPISTRATIWARYRRPA